MMNVKSENLEDVKKGNARNGRTNNFGKYYLKKKL